MVGLVKVFRAGPEDDELAIEAMREVHGHADVDPDALREALRDLGRYLFLAVQGGRVIGSLSGHAIERMHRHGDEFLLYEVDVRPAYRGRGVGRALLSSFVEMARGAGAREMWVLTNASNAVAVRMYEACGFRRVNSDDVMMQLKF